MAINNNTIRVDIFETIYNTIYNNLNSFTTTPKPKLKASYNTEDSEFPIIVINPITKENNNYSFNQSNPTMEILVVLEVYTKKNKDRDILCDELEKLLKTPISGLQMTAFNSSVDFNNANQNRIFSATVSISYLRK